MDEGTLNDLLECSVCLERLDTSSKVLPCQHTFCKKCLEEIVVTKKELRCPECRVLVETSIDDLPPNVLLMRILEGMRNAAPKRRTTGAPSIHHQRSYSQPVGGTIFPSATMASAVPAAITQHAPHSLTPDGMMRIHSNIKQMPQAWPPPYARAVYDYVSKEPGDLSFKKGDIITLKKQVDQNWYHGEIGGVHGVFPLCYVQIMPPPSNIPQCKAMFDFRMANEEEEGCLTFVKGEIMTVIRRVDENWVEGRKGDRVGIFPIAFVQMNDVARAFIKLTTNLQPGPSRIAPPTPTSEETTPLIPTDHSQVAVTLQQHHPSSQSATQTQNQHPTPQQIAQSQNQTQNPSLAQPVQQGPHTQPQSLFQLQPQLAPLLQPQSLFQPQPQLGPQLQLGPQPQLQPQLQPPLQPQPHPQMQPQPQPQPQSQPQPQPQPQPQQQAQSQPQLQPQPAPASSAPKPPTSVAASFPADSSSSTSSSSTTPNTSSTSSSSSSSTTPSSPASPPPRPSAWSPQTRPSRSSTGSSHENSHNQQKRHSLTALLAAPAQQSSSNRHSAEVLGSADLSEANIEVPSNGEFVRQGSGRHHRRSGSSELPLSSVGSVPPPLPQGIHHSLVNNSNLPATYIALYPYKPQKADELELRKGGVYTVTERCQDGWFKGTSNRTQKSGVFPGNYVAFVKSVPGAQQQARSAPRGGANSNTPTRSASSGAVSPHSSAAASSSTTSPSPVSYTKERKSNSSSPQTSSLRQPQAGSEPPTLPPRSVSPAQISSTAGAVSWHTHQSSLTATEATRTTPSTSPQAPPAQGAQSSPQSSQSSVSPSSASTSAAPSTTPVGTPLKTSSDKVKEKKERGSVSLMRRLTNMKKSKSPPPPYSMDNPVFEDGSVFGTPTHSVHPAHPVHVRSGSCPSQLLQLPLPESQQSQSQHHRAVPATATAAAASTASTATGAGGSQRLRHKERQNVVVTNFAPSGRQGDGVAAATSSQTPSSHHRKSNSLDAGSSHSASSNGHSTHSSPHASSHGESSRKSKQLVQPARERFRCVVAYPPHSEYELELRVGDVIYVHRKREDGWYKGTQQRTGRTGLFPASFVEAF